MSDWPQPIDDELISAYVDDQLSGDERERFEQQLAKRGDYRQAVQELTALRQALQALPAYRLDADFPRRVLQHAERAMLTGRAQVDEAPHTSATPVTERGRPWWPRYWPALAAIATLAATLLITLIMPGQRLPQHVAERGEEEPLVRRNGLPALEPAADVAAAKIDREATAKASEVWSATTPQSLTDAELADDASLADAPARGGHVLAKRDAVRKTDDSPVNGVSITPAKQFAGRAGAYYERYQPDVTSTAGKAMQRSPRGADQRSAIEELDLGNLDAVITLDVKARISDQELSAALARQAITLTSTARQQVVGDSLRALQAAPRQARATSERFGGGLTARRRQILHSQATLAAGELVYVEASRTQVQGLLHELEDHAIRSDWLQVTDNLQSSTRFHESLADKVPAAAADPAPADANVALGHVAGERSAPFDAARDEARQEAAESVLRRRTPAPTGAQSEMLGKRLGQSVTGPRGQTAAARPTVPSNDETQSQSGYAVRVIPMPPEPAAMQDIGQVAAPASSAGWRESDAEEEADARQLPSASFRTSRDGATETAKREQDVDDLIGRAEVSRGDQNPTQLPAQISEVNVRILIVLNEVSTSPGNESGLDAEAAAEVEAASETERKEN